MIKIIAFLMIFASSVSNAVTVPHAFNPTVVINKSMGINGLELVAPRFNFAGFYDVDLKTFRDITIPFKIRSSTGAPLQYSLSLVSSNHVCEIDATSNETLNVDTQLDNVLFSRSVIYGTSTAITEQEHKLKLVFKGTIAQPSSSFRACTGTVSIRAEVVI